MASLNLLKFALFSILNIENCQVDRTYISQNLLEYSAGTIYTTKSTISFDDYARSSCRFGSFQND